MWQLTLEGRMQHLDEWNEFLAQKNVKAITKDVWDMLLTFSNDVDAEMRNYDDDGGPKAPPRTAPSRRAHGARAHGARARRVTSVTVPTAVVSSAPPQHGLWSSMTLWSGTGRSTASSRTERSQPWLRPFRRRPASRVSGSTRLTPSPSSLPRRLRELGVAS